MLEKYRLISRNDTSRFAIIPGMKHIVVALRYSIPSGQHIWRGIRRYVADHACDWEIAFKRDAEEFTEMDVSLLARNPPDGVICALSHKLNEAQRTLRALAGLVQVPLVPIRMLDFPEFARRRTNISFVETDAEALGELAADHFLAQGAARSYAYVPTRDEDVWSVLRGEKFAAALRRHGHGCRRYRPCHDPVADREALSEWLLALPRPCGLFATNDSRGAEILSVLRDKGIDVPGEISVLGCANDDAIAPFTTPPLSSVVLPLEAQGYAAAEQLNRLLRRRALPQKPVVKSFAPTEIVARESTVAVSYSGKLVQRALSFIRSTLPKDLSSEDVAAHLGVSRRLLDLRFRQLQNTTVSNTIRAERLELLKSALQRRTDTIERISSDCGFASANSAKRMFKSAYGVTMKDFSLKASLTATIPSAPGGRAARRP